jgi:hypothetical protein
MFDIIVVDWRACLVVQFRAAPVTALLVPADAVTSTHADPEGNRLVLVDLLRVFLLDREGLETTHLETLAKS